MAEEVLIKFTGDAGSLLGATRSIQGEVKTLGQLFDQMKNQGKSAYLESAKGATALSQTLGTSFRNAKQFADSIGLSTTAANQAAQRLGELDRAGAKTTEKYRALRAEFGLSRQAFEALNGTFNQNSRAQTQLAQTLGLSIGAARNLATDLGLSASKANDSIGRYRELSAVGASLAEKQRVLTQELGLSVDQFEAVRKVSLATREGLVGIAGVAGGVAAALGAISNRSLQVFTEFDSVIRTFGVISEGTAAQVGVVRDEIERLGTTTTKAPKEVANLAVELSKAGFTSEQVKDSLGGIVLASQATGEGLERTGEVVGNVINQFGLAATDSNRIADLLVATSNKSAAGTNDLGEALAYVGTQAKQSNQSLDDTLLALGQLANSGIKGSAAGTGLAEALRRLKLASANATTELSDLRTKGSKTAVAAFKQIDQAVRGANGELLPLPKILDALKTSLANVAPPERDLINNALFGVQGGRVVQTLISGNAEQTKLLADGLLQAEGAAQKAGDALSQGPAAGLQRLQAASDVALASIGEFLATGFLPLIDLSGLLLSTFNALPAPLQGLVVGVGGVAAALAAATAAIAAYKLTNAGLIIEQTIAAAGLIKETVLRGAATAATIAQTGAIGVNSIAQRANAIAQSQVSIASAKGLATTIASVTATKAMALATAVATAATKAWAFATGGGLVSALSTAGVAATGLAAKLLAFLPVAVVLAGAFALIAEASRKTEQEKFRDEIEKSTQKIREFRGEAAKKAESNAFDDLAAAYDRFGKRLQERGPIGALQATLVDLQAALRGTADASAKFGDEIKLLGIPLNLITREQLGAQQATIALGDRLQESGKISNASGALIAKYGLNVVDAGDKTRLGAAGIAEFNKAAAAQIDAIDKEIIALKALALAAEKSGDTQGAQTLNTQIAALESNKRALNNRTQALAQDGSAQDANSEKVKKSTLTLEEQKKVLDELKKTINGVSENVEIGGISADEGEAELNKIAQANANNVAAQRAVKDEILKIRQAEIDEVDKLLRSGEISEAESITRLEAIRSRTGSKAAKVSAAEEETRIKKEQIEAEIELNKAGIAAIEAQVAAGAKNAGEAEKEITALKLAEIDKRIAAARLEAEAETTESGKKKAAATVRSLEAEKQKVQAESTKKIAEAQAKAAEEERQATIEQFNGKLKALEVGYQKGEKSEAQYLAEKQKLQTEQADEEIKQLKQQLEKLGAEDKKGRASITTKIAEAELKKLNVQKEAQKAQLDALKKAQDKAIDLIQQSEQERLIEIQQAVNAGVLAEEKAGQLKSDATRQRLAAELAAVRENQAKLDAVESKGLGKEAAEELEIAKREARQKTTALTLQLLEAEQSAQKAAREAVIKGLQDELAAKVRVYDQQLSRIADVKAAQERSANAAAAAAAKEIAAFEQSANALQRQTNLLAARSNLQSAQNALAQTETTIAADRTKQALDLRKALNDQNLSQIERVAIERELSKLGFSGRSSEFAILQKEQALQQQLAEQKRQALKQEQETARSVLALETQRNQIAAQRSVTEARINELKAQQAILTAQQALEEQRINDQKAIAEAKSALAQAKAGTDRQAIAAAQAQVRLAEDAAKRNQAGAVQGVDLARQQADLAKQSTAEAIAAQAAQSELETIAAQTLTVQQQQATAQLEAALAAERQAQALTLARAQAEAIVAAQGRTGQPIEARFAGGPIAANRLYTMAERGPELIKFAGGKQALVETPGLYRAPARGQVYTAEQTRRMLGQSTAPAIATGPKRDPVIDELRRTRKVIESRKPPTATINVDRADDRDVDRILRSLIRARF
jgi:TP901 family phage tail tape measure protein